MCKFAVILLSEIKDHLRGPTWYHRELNDRTTITEPIELNLRIFNPISCLIMAYPDVSRVILRMISRRTEANTTYLMMLILKVYQNPRLLAEADPLVVFLSARAKEIILYVFITLFTLLSPDCCSFFTEDLLNQAYVGFSWLLFLVEIDTAMIKLLVVVCIQNWLYNSFTTLLLQLCELLHILSISLTNLNSARLTDQFLQANHLSLIFHLN